MRGRHDRSEPPLAFADARQGTPAPDARRGALAADVSHPTVARYLEQLMMRNFATNTWRFRADGRVSLPGCVIASPSRAADPETDQDYLNSWVRDSALCVAQAATADLPWNRTELLDEYVRFSRVTQRTAAESGRAGHACFHIDGQPRPWSAQSDGPALRTIAVLGFFDRLSAAGRQLARALIEDDVRYLLAAYDRPTTNLWEETEGFHFFTRAVQKRALDLVSRWRPEPAPRIDRDAVRAAATRLTRQLDEHWDAGRGYFRATLGGAGRGGDVDSSTVMGAVYGALPVGDPRLLATVSAVRDAFEGLYRVNERDRRLGMGPLIGRYPEDDYDGNAGATVHTGHPWPLCTAVVAEYHYRLARRLCRDGRVSVDDLSRRFFEQIGFDAPAGTYRAGSVRFATAIDRVIQAGDRMLRAVLAHSDRLELSEQYDRDTGHQRSVRNLTWSYAAYLGAIDARARCQRWHPPAEARAIGRPADTRAVGRPTATRSLAISTTGATR